MRKTVWLAAMLVLVGCEAPSTDPAQTCQKTCAPRPVKSWTWDGWKHSSVCECDLESRDK
jgi:hypothetical protein